MKYSVIIPVYNVERQLNKCLDSVASQNRTDLDVIIVDDGSTDSSGQICDDYAGRFDNFRVVHQSNKGLSGARNAGLELAKGEWILFLDADDYWAEGFLDIMDETIVKHPSDYYKFNYEKVFDNEKPIRNALIVENEAVNLAEQDEKLSFLTDRLLTYSVGWEAPTGVYRKSLIDEFDIRFTDTKRVFAEDMLFTMEYILHAKSAYLICNFLYMYYTREGSLSINTDNESMLPRLYNLLEIFGAEIKPYKVLHRNFYKVYFHIVNFHVKYNLKDVAVETLITQIKELDATMRYSKFGKQIKKDRTLCGYIMYGRNWL